MGEFVTAWSAESARNDSGLQANVDSLLQAYPRLIQDQGYVAYLRRFGGALLVRDSDGLVVSLYGFSHDIGMHIVDGPGDPVFDGCLVFCDLVVPRLVRAPHVLGTPRDTMAIGFGFESTGARRKGIYRFIDGGSGEWYCENFLEWLSALLRTDGQLNT